MKLQPTQSVHFDPMAQGSTNDPSGKEMKRRVEDVEAEALAGGTSAWMFLEASDICHGHKVIPHAR